MNNENSDFFWSFIPGFSLVAILWVVAFFQNTFHLNLGHFGIYPLTALGFWGIFTSPFIHANYIHLIGNSIPLIVLISFVYQISSKHSLKIFLIIFFLQGLGTFIIGRPAYHIGASGIIYGLATFIFFIGIVKRDKTSLALSLLVVFLYGSMVWGLLPTQKSVSWEAHLSGAIGGGLYGIWYGLNYDEKPLVVRLKIWIRQKTRIWRLPKTQSTHFNHNYISTTIIKNNQKLDINIYIKRRNQTL